jgi:hypothetical protein
MLEPTPLSLCEERRIIWQERAIAAEAEVKRLREALGSLGLLSRRWSWSEARECGLCMTTTKPVLIREHPAFPGREEVRCPKCAADEDASEARAALEVGKQ